MRSREITLTYIAAVVGAGFASGREILQFFSIYGTAAIWGVLTAGLLLTVFSGLLLYQLLRDQPDDYSTLFNEAVGWWLGAGMDVSISVFIFGGVAVVLAGLATLLSETLAWSFSFSLVAVVVSMLVLVWGEARALVSISRGFVPVLFIGVLILWWQEGLPLFSDEGFNLTTALQMVSEDGILLGMGPVSSGLLYAGFNAMLLTVTFSGLVEDFRKVGTRAAVHAAARAGIILTLFIGVTTSVIMLHLPAVVSDGVPLQTIAGSHGVVWFWAVTLLIGLGMVTTGLSSLMGLANRLAIHPLNRQWMALILVIAAWPVSYAGFARLVGSVYPLMGVMGVVFLTGYFYHSIFGNNGIV